MVSELEYYDTNIPCLAACPVHTNAGMYVAAIADGDDELAYLTARLPNPFASVCGRVCAAPCEDACRRGAIDRPIAIRALKRFVTEQFGPEQGSSDVWKRVAAPPKVELPQSIGIVGGGPAGMACAHDLRQLGYRVTVYEATDKLGGAMWLGIPEYRLDRGVLAADIDAILGLGVEVRYETRLGVDITLDELMQQHDAVFLGIGATLGRGLDIPGADADGVFKAIEFLINMNRGFSVDVGERVVVIGGGDVAMDAARTALRASDYEAGDGDSVGRRDRRRPAIGDDRGDRRRPHGGTSRGTTGHGHLTRIPRRDAGPRLRSRGSRARRHQFRRPTRACPCDRRGRQSGRDRDDRGHVRIRRRRQVRTRVRRRRPQIV